MKIIYVIMSKYVKFNLQFNYIDLTLNKLFFSQEDMDVDFFNSDFTGRRRAFPVWNEHDG